MKNILPVLAMAMVLLAPVSVADEGTPRADFMKSMGEFLDSLFSRIAAMMSAMSGSRDSSGPGSGEDMEIPVMERMDNSGPGSDSSREEMKEKLEITAESFDGVTQVKVKTEFMTASHDIDAILGELEGRLDLTGSDIDAILKMEQEEEGPQERLRVEIKSDDDLNRVKFEFRFPLETDAREEIVSGIQDRLESLAVDDLQTALEMKTEKETTIGRIRINDDEIRARIEQETVVGGITEIEVKVFADSSKVEIKRGEAEEEFFVDSTDLDTIVSEVVTRTGLTTDEVRHLLDVEQELEIENDELEVEIEHEAGIEIENEREQEDDGHKDRSGRD